MPLGVSQYQLAKAVDVPARRINEIVRGQRRITADTALRLSRYFGTSERFWLNRQARYDLETERTGSAQHSMASTRSAQRANQSRQLTPRKRMNGFLRPSDPRECVETLLSRRTDDPVDTRSSVRWPAVSATLSGRAPESAHSPRARPSVGGRRWHRGRPGPVGGSRRRGRRPGPRRSRARRGRPGTGIGRGRRAGG